MQFEKPGWNFQNISYGNDVSQKFDMVCRKNDNQVPYSNSVRLNAELNRTTVPHKLITPIGSGSNHMLGGLVVSLDGPTLYSNQNWVKEAKEWLEKYLR